jgi:hypothetical protein
MINEILTAEVRKQWVNWCECAITTASVLVPPYKDCPLCPREWGREWLVEDTIILDHYHCVICTKLTQIG